MTDPDGAIAWVAVAVLGVLAGWALVAALPRLLAEAGDAAGPTPATIGRWVLLAAPLAAVALWWWESVARGQLPSVAIEPATVGGARFAGHVVFFTLLAAASWIDMRQRVIPDAVTAPGVFAGLAWSAVVPAALLPIAVEVPRSFAQPELVPDVLGLCGGLRAALPPWWLEPRPSLPGLAVALAVFLCWWWFCTAASDLAPPLRQPRHLLLIAGVAGVVVAWWCGGMPWRGLLTGLAGLAVGAAMIWLTRVGASRALGREAMGFGDVTLMAMVGSWLGWQAAVIVALLAVFIGLAHGTVQLMRHRESELPFGPSLCLASVLTVVAWRPLWDRTAAAFDQPLEIGAVVATIIALTAVSLTAWRRMRDIPADQTPSE
jgi:prepilin signal peptidase PulO-like enzyme (type II secretory pathway)